MQIIDIRLLSCDFKAKRNFEMQSDIDTSADIGYGSSYNEETCVITGMVRARLPQDAKAPYSFEIEIGGKFKITKDEEEHVERLRHVNIPAIIFPYLREAVADITRRGGHPALHLPPVNFVRAAEEKRTESACKD
ncbi:hypothetical protein MASR1M90_04420 [Desulfovibrionales bacterium]